MFAKSRGKALEAFTFLALTSLTRADAHSARVDGAGDAVLNLDINFGQMELASAREG